MKETIQNSTTERLLQNKEEIMQTWQTLVKKELEAAKPQKALALRNFLPDFISHLAQALSGKIDRTAARKKADNEKSTWLGKQHGRERAISSQYTIDQLIFEYHILRQVIFDVMERDKELIPTEREFIIGAIEQAVNDAATEFSKTHRELQQRYTYALAHDLRGSITVAKAAAQMITRKPDDVKNCIDKAKRITDSMDRLDIMILDLLDAARLGAGEKLSLEFEECDLDEIIRQVVEVTEGIQKDIVQVKSDGACIGYWNSNALRRVLENLVDNALKYGEANKPIIVSLKQKEDSVEVSVHNDNGGKIIPPEEKNLLFEQFMRSKKTEEDHRGWGIGLSVVKGIIEAHNGSIRVESDKDTGTNFIFNLPKNLH